MAKFKVTQEASLIWEGSVEYNGIEYQYRYYDGRDAQAVYILTENGWELETELGDVIYAYCQKSGSPGQFGHVGKEIEIEDELVEEYS